MSGKCFTTCVLRRLVFRGTPSPQMGVPRFSEVLFVTTIKCVVTNTHDALGGWADV